MFDTGASVNVMNEYTFKSLGNKYSLQKTDVVLRSVSGASLPLLGKVCVNLVLQDRMFPTDFYVIRNMKHNLIIGREFMHKYQVKLDLGRNTCQIRDLILELNDLSQLRNLVRLHEDVELPPNHFTTVYGKYHKKAKITYGSSLLISHENGGFLAREPGIAIMNSLAIAKQGRKIPISIINQTGKHFKLNKGNVIANVTVINKDHEVSEVTMVPPKVDVTDPNARIKDVQHENLTKEQQEKFDAFIQRNLDIFAKSEFDIGKCNLMKAKIETTTQDPIRKKPYRTPFAYRDEVKRQINEMLSHGLVTPSQSDYASPILCVKKKSGETRMCVDFRSLNQITKKYSFPMPNVDDIFTSLSNARYFSNLDFIKGYYQIELSEKSKPKTAFIVADMGLFQYNFMPFGLCNAPSIFQACMSKLLNGLNSFATAYLDDVVIWSESFEEHLDHLGQVFDRIRKANMKLKRNKCEFFKEQINYLGHVITNKGEIKVDPDKVKVIANLKAPTCVRDVRAFLGMCSYYRRFIPGFANIAKSLTGLTRKHSQFVWNHEHQKSFEQLKQALITQPVLKLPEMGKPFQLFVDASDKAIGCLLTQEDNDTYKPVSYASHQLSSTQLRWSTIEKECYAILFGIEKFRPFLEGTHFNVYSDHNPLKFINSVDNKNAKLQRWATKISAYGATIHFIKGKDNVQADFLSRLNPENIPKFPDHDEINSRIDDVNIVNLDKVNLDVENRHHNEEIESEKPTQAVKLHCNWEIDKFQINDRHCASIIKSLEEKGTKSKYYKRYVVVDGILHYVNTNEEIRIVVPSVLQETIIKEIHAGSTGGHIGRDRTFDLLRKRYYWKGLATQVYDFVAKCKECNEQHVTSQNSPMQETSIAHYPFQRISIDTCGPYPLTERENRFCLTVTDNYSGWIEVFPMADKKAETIARILVDQVFARHSWCRFMTSDNGTEVVNEIMKAITDLGHIHHIRTSIYHPQSNAFAERPHRTMVNCLAKLSNKHDWDLYVPSFMTAYNSSISASRKYSPFFLLYHRDPVLPLDTILEDRGHYYGEDFLPTALERMHLAYHLVRENIKKQNAINRNYKEKYAKGQVPIDVGDPVYLKKYIRDGKLDKRWESHYRVLEKTGPASYIVQNALTGITKRVHANDVRKAKHSDNGDIIPPTEEVISDNDTDTESESSVEDDLENETENEQSENEQSKKEQSENKTVKKKQLNEQKSEPVPSRPKRIAAKDALAKMRAVNEVSVDLDTVIESKLSYMFSQLSEQLKR